jgi:hypothetical protein
MGLLGLAEEMSCAAFVLADMRNERQSDGACSCARHLDQERTGTRSILRRPVGVIYADHTER